MSLWTRGGDRVSLTNRQMELLRKMGKVFAPHSTEELCQQLYPNHDVWKTMGEDGRKSWGGLMSKTVAMLGRLERLDIVWRVGGNTWAVSDKIDSEAVRHYFDWLTVMADEFQGGGEEVDRQAAQGRLCWFLTQASGYFKSQLRSHQDYVDTVLICLRALIHSTDWKERRHRLLTAQAVKDGILHVLKPLRLPESVPVRQELVEALVYASHDASQDVGGWTNGSRVLGECVDLLVVVGDK